MKKLLLLFSFAAVLMMTGCGKDNELDSPENDVRYYVKYEVSVSSSYIGDLYVDAKTERGTQSFKTSSKLFSETFGPVSKGFAASVTAHTDYTVTGAMHSSIYVCRGEEPFVLKATGSSSADYVIDF